MRLVTQCFSCHVARLIRVVTEQIDKIAQEMRQHVCWITEHPQRIREIPRWDDRSKSSLVVAVAYACGAEAREEQREVLPLRLSFLAGVSAVATAAAIRNVPL